ncbi:MAG: hypothetical protein QOJ15_3717 [Bradyrhizobium sp.]|jgi:hypothetical protein|nr:hypothetical protein [Bradyrhizobium sp.]
MRPAAAALALFAHLALNGNAAMAQDAARSMTLELPRPLAAGETAFIEVQLGPIGRGRTIEVTTAAGQPLGTISPFGVRTGQDAGTYPLPVPEDAIRDGRLSVRLTISQPGGSARAPTADEVHSVKLGVGPAPR